MDEITNDGPLEYLSVAWDVTTVCNYDCWYCHPSLKDGKYRWPDLEAALDFFNELAREKLVYLDLGGGEPTLWPRLPEFLRGLDPSIEVCITTNGSRSINWWRKNVEYVAGVSLSFHTNTADPKNFIDTVRELASYDKVLYVKIIGDYKKIDVIEKLYNELYDSGLSISCNVIPIKNLIDSKENDDFFFDRDFITSNSFDRSVRRYRNKSDIPFFNGVPFKVNEFQSQKKNTFKGWTCSIGNTRLYITADGSIYRGTCKVGGKVGNIFIDTTLKIVGDVVCSRDVCYCGDEIVLRKFK